MESDQPPTTQASTRKPGRRVGTVYDAVAGRITSNGLLHDATQHDNSTRKRNGSAIAPEQVLNRRKHGSQVEGDGHARHRLLDSSKQKLPDSDLLKLILAYTADFYARTSQDGGRSDQRSMDETALIAMGILLEEAANEVIGKTGQLALIEDS